MKLAVELDLSSADTADTDLTNFIASLEDELISVFRSNGLPDSFKKESSNKQNSMGLPETIQWVVEYAPELRVGLQILLPLGKKVYQFIRSYGSSTSVKLEVQGREITISNSYDSLDELEKDIRDKFTDK